MSQAMQLARLRALLPRGWFPDDAPNLDAVLAGPALVFDWLGRLYAYVRAQTRLRTATGAWLDRRVADYLGPTFRRRTGETDALYAARAADEVLRPRVTRAALIRAVTQVAGAAPRVFEPSDPRDTGGWNTPALAWDTAGAWGTYLLPAQAFVDIARPLNEGVANQPGWDTTGLAWDTAGGWTTRTAPNGTPTDADLYAVVANTVAAGVTAWTRINAP